MLKHIKNLLERNSLLLAIASSCLVLVLSFINMRDVPNPDIPYMDKIEHVLAYTVISFFWLLSCHLGKINKSYFSLILIIISFGIVIEILQGSVTNYRTADLRDVLANTLGVVLGFLFLKLLNRIYLQV